MLRARGECSGSRRCALRRQAAWAERQPGRPASRARPLSLDDLLARIAKKEVEEVVGGWLEAARSRRMRLLLYASGVERPARGVPAMARAGPRVPAMGLQQRPKLDTQTYEMEKVCIFTQRLSIKHFAVQTQLRRPCPVSPGLKRARPSRDVLRRVDRGAACPPPAATCMHAPCTLQHV